MATIIQTSYGGTLPPQISGLALWLDAADSTTLTLSGTTVTQWVDKSSNAYRCISNANYTGTSLPTFCNISVPSVNLAPNQALVTSNAWNYSPAWSCFVAINSISLGMRWLISPHNGATPVLMGMSAGTSKIWNSGFVTAPADITGQHIEYTSAENTGATSNLLWYRDGTLQASKVKTLGSGSGTMYMGIGANGSLGNAMAGTYQLYEVIIYNKYLSVSERQQVESYLAWKWNVQKNLPTSHPYYNNPLFTNITFAPYATESVTTSSTIPNIAGLSLWLDGQDTSTMSFSGNNVTTWRDKSGLSNHATATGSISNVANSLNGYNAMVYPGVYNNYFRGPLVNTTNGLVTGFAVFQMKSTSFGASRVISLGIPGFTEFNNVKFAAFLERYNTSFLNSYRSGTPLATISYNYTPALACVIYDGTSNYIYLNGTAGTQVASSGTFGYSNYELGSDFGEETIASVHYDGSIGEIVMFNQIALTTPQRQQMEGYLAWKWGLQSSLPVSHPYYNTQYFSGGAQFPITIATPIRCIQSPYWSPTSFSGLGLWLDAADSTTVQLAPGTTNVSNWLDKSGNGRTGTANGTVLYANRAVGGLNTISFTAVTNSYIRGNISITGITFTCFAVATLSASSKNDSRILSLGVIGSNDYSSALYAAAICRTGSTNTFYTFRNLSGTSSLSVTYNVPFLICALYDGTNKSLFINSIGTTNGSVGTFNISNYQIGSSFTEEAIFNYGGYIGEEIVYSNALTTAQRQQVEGYLAWKWGLQTQLPSTHPNRYIPP